MQFDIRSAKTKTMLSSLFYLETSFNSFYNHDTTKLGLGH